MATERPAGDNDAGIVVTLDDGTEVELDHGRVVIAAITSCNNTSNPSVMIGAGLLAKRRSSSARADALGENLIGPGLDRGHPVPERAGLDDYLDRLGFNLVGYGCTTCIGNSGPLPDAISSAINDNEVVVCAVLSGNRNFEGRIQQDVRNNYLASLLLCVDDALAWVRMDIDLQSEPLGIGADGTPVHLSDILAERKRRSRRRSPTPSARRCSRAATPTSSPATSAGRSSRPARATADTWLDSTYVRKPPSSIGGPVEPELIEPVRGARVLAVLGDSVTTDHISPAGASRRRAWRAPGSSKTGSSRATSTPTARDVATTR